MYEKGILISGEGYRENGTVIGVFDDDQINKGAHFVKLQSCAIYNSGGHYYEGYSKDDRNAEGLGIVYVTKGGPVLQSGFFIRGFLKKGEFFRQCGRCYAGMFDTKNYLNGEGCIFTDHTKTKLSSKGVYKSGKLVSGELYSKDGTCSVGTFCSSFLQETEYSTLDGEGCVFFDHDKTRLSSKGTYKEGKLVSGETFSKDGKYYTGNFVWDDNLPTGVGKAFIDANKTCLLSKGRYEKGCLVYGEKYGLIPSSCENKCYVGAFESEEFIRGIIFFDNEQTKMESNGEYKNGFLIKGELHMHLNREELYEHSDVISDFGGIVCYSGNFSNGKIYGIGYKYITFYTSGLKLDGECIETKHMFVNGVITSTIKRI